MGENTQEIMDLNGDVQSGVGVSSALAMSENKPVPGMKCDLVNLYRNDDGDWVKDYPSNLVEAAEDEETAQCAMIVRNEKSSDSRKKLEIHSIIVQSPLIKNILKTVLDGYRGITVELDRLEFDAPFEPFVHRWEKLRNARAEVHDPATKEHLELLWTTLEAELKVKIDKSKDLIAHNVMTYDLLWTMFEPGTLVYANIEGDDRILRTQSYSYSCYPVPCFQVFTELVTWDGQRFGTTVDTQEIGQYKGTESITNLSVFPLGNHPSAAGVQQCCILRGRIFESFKGFHYKSYNGVATNTQHKKYSVDSRIIVDTAAFNTFNPNQRIRVGSLIDDETYVAPPLPSGTPEDCSLNDFQLMLCSTFVRGYSLKDKDWLKFHISSIKEIVWNDKAFSSLVLPKDTKDLIFAFASAQLKRDQAFDDVVKGKGRGVIMLLSGPPGVGKTLTAESVAEAMRVPLYMMSAGDLGTDPSHVESSLTKILNMTTKWKAVLLLDEADVFLEARSISDLERNKLVSIFLRILEYYEGFLFLTSNRVENIDAAFESRIHLSLQYGSLSCESRKQVWTSFLGAGVKNGAFSGAQIDSLARIDLNGRQIKNILKTAQLLATSKDVELSFEHVNIVTKLRAAHSCIPLKSS
jgi:hypothetical protein